MKKYKDTLNLPQTKFPIKSNPKREEELIAQWNESKLYEKTRIKRTSHQFVLHDGPPYANGHLHHGHILNKILKDIVVKHKSLLGYNANFVPGWDCHGLPIETQVDKKLGSKRYKMEKNDLRSEYRKYANRFVDIQRDEFKRLGILADWDNPYRTMDYSYEAQTLRELAKFSRAGLLYKDLKPVFWCPTHRTALANSDIEYKDDHQSKSVYVLFPLLQSDVNYLLVWTTTPWTLNANRAIAFNKDITYCHVDLCDGKRVLLAKDRLDDLTKKFGWNVLASQDVSGSCVDYTCYKNPLNGTSYYTYPSDHVTADTGTGLVHIAPAHGEDDFRLGKKHHLPVDSAIQSDGKTKYGLTVSQSSQDVIQKFDDLGLLVKTEMVTHSYPYSTRSHKPVIVKATKQWFIDIDKPYNNGPTLRERALKALDEVEWLPKHGYNRIKAMLEARPDWCISRQRSWGVPIGGMKCLSCDEYYSNAESLDAMAELVEFSKDGLDFWFRPSDENEIPCEKCGGERAPETDILDVWFDSGVSNASVMGSKQVDLYLEGSDQHRGWFQSSLLAALGANELVPYKTVLTHGFVVDDKGEKLSKSKGNYVDPFKYIKQNGAEILRLWVASSDYKNDIKVSNTILDNIKQTHHRIRNTIRYMIASTYGFKRPDDWIDTTKLNDLDKYILILWRNVYNKCMDAYRNYEYHIVVRTIENFCNLDLSSFYFDIIKDSMYCDGLKSFERRSAQTLMFSIASEMSRLMSPIMSFTMDDAWNHVEKLGSVHNTMLPAKVFFKDDKLVKRFEKLRELKQKVNQALEEKRDLKEIGASIDADVELYCSTEEKNLIWWRWGCAELAKLFNVSNVVVKSDASKNDVEVKIVKASGPQCQRCWKYSDSVGKMEPTDVCIRCSEVLND